MLGLNKLEALHSWIPMLKIMDPYWQAKKSVEAHFGSMMLKVMDIC